MRKKWVAMLLGFALVLVGLLFAVPASATSQCHGQTCTVSWFATGYVDGHGPNQTPPNSDSDVTWPQHLFKGQTCDGVIQTDVYDYKNHKADIDKLLDRGTLDKDGSHSDKGFVISWSFQVLPKCHQQSSSPTPTVTVTTTAPPVHDTTTVTAPPVTETVTTTAPPVTTTETATETTTETAPPVTETATATETLTTTAVATATEVQTAVITHTAVKTVVHTAAGKTEIQLVKPVAHTTKATSLANTGVTTNSQIAIALALLAGGALIMLLARRPKSVRKH